MTLVCWSEILVRRITLVVEISMNVREVVVTVAEEEKVSSATSVKELVI